GRPLESVVVDIGSGPVTATPSATDGAFVLPTATRLDQATTRGRATWTGATAAAQFRTIVPIGPPPPMAAAAPAGSPPAGGTASASPPASPAALRPAVPAAVGAPGEGPATATPPCTQPGARWRSARPAHPRRP